jgi:hypothetical protein
VQASRFMWISHNPKLASSTKERDERQGPLAGARPLRTIRGDSPLAHRRPYLLERPRLPRVGEGKRGFELVLGELFQSPGNAQQTEVLPLLKHYRHTVLHALLGSDTFQRRLQLLTSSKSNNSSVSRPHRKDLAHCGMLGSSSQGDLRNNSCSKWPISSEDGTQPAPGTHR